MSYVKPIAFRLHFNRINMQRGLSTVWTVHTSKQCIPAEKVIVNVPLTAVYLGPEARQPRAFMSGKGYITKQGNVVTINGRTGE